MKYVWMMATGALLVAAATGCTKTAAVNQGGAPVAGVENVESDALKLVRYDPTSKVLTLGFARGTYAYADVPAEVYESMLKSGSLGGFYQSDIKGKYTASKAE
jgi:hypothetical protein